ncbi:hypothetical protein FRC04_007326 [Tulasnella sp. 424]|nr:hypothetical protein FRC04_007326 [Tulasnella sp. 424]KAG8959290.1 hypothetical protein FRC05_007913 [Tulasnella sp. 425]
MPSLFRDLNTNASQKQSGSDQAGTTTASTAVTAPSRKTRSTLAKESAAILAENTDSANGTTASKANGRALRQTMKKKQKAVASQVSMEKEMEETFIAAGGIITNGRSAAAKLDKRKVTLDAPGRLAASIAQTPIKAVPNKQRFAFGAPPSNHFSPAPSIPPTPPAAIRSPSPIVANQQAAFPRTDNNLEQPRVPSPTPVPDEKPNVPVRLEIIPYGFRDKAFAPTTTLFVNVPVGDPKPSGKVTCRLSDVLPEAAKFESPLKSHDHKLYRPVYGAEPAVLGRGDMLSNPVLGGHLRQHDILDTFEVTPTHVGGRMIYTGITIFVDETSKSSDRPSGPPPKVHRSLSQPRRHSASSGDERPLLDNGLSDGSPTPCRNRPASPSARHSVEPEGIAETPKPRSKRPLSTKAKSSRPNKKPKLDISDEEESDQLSREDQLRLLYRWIRSEWELKTGQLPGEVKCDRARQALDRYRKVKEIIETFSSWGNCVPEKKGIPSEIRGMYVQALDIQTALGFKDGKWHALAKCWSSQELAGCKIIQQWVQDPDAEINGPHGPEKAFPHLNGLRFNDLKTMMVLDRQGELTRFGPKDGEDQDNGYNSGASRRSSSRPRFMSADLDEDEDDRYEKSKARPRERLPQKKLSGRRAY